MTNFLLSMLSNQFLFIQFFDRLQEGGLFFMMPLLMLLLLTLFLIVRSVIYINKKDTYGLQKYIKLIDSVGLLALVWGMLGQLIGIIGMFDNVEQIGEISTHVFAGGLKVSALPPVFGFFVFIVSRVASIILTWFQSEQTYMK